MMEALYVTFAALVVIVFYALCIRAVLWLEDLLS